MFRNAALDRLVPGDHDRVPPDGARYESLFVHWEDRASVRRRPHRVFAQADGELLFPPELHPVVLHPVVAAAPPEVTRVLLAWRLYDYLEFTAELESVTVIPVAMRLARGGTGLVLPGQMVADAFNIVTDEAWHAQFSHDFLRQLVHDVGIPTAQADRPHAFVGRLEQISRAMPDHLAGLDLLLFSIVSETLISGILSDLPQDQRLPRSVRDLVADHAADEGRHHVYFRAVLRHLWPVLTTRERAAVGPWIPRIVNAFLEPDYERTWSRLVAVGLPPEQARQVVVETWPEARVVESVAAAARQTLGYFATAGAFGSIEAADALEEAGIWGC